MNADAGAIESAAAAGKAAPSKASGAESWAMSRCVDSASSPGASYPL